MSAARARGGQLVVENVTLLSGGATCFEQRYHVSLADDSFRKPGNTKVAFPLLHFLLCTVAPDDSAEFKPCFPVLDREQERDFKRIVDERLGRLERAKLLPLGVARKSTIAAAGGDKFEQLVWALSTFALKQAANRHPAHAGNQNPDPKPPSSGGTEANRKYAQLLRSRIASERAAFARTTQMGRDSTERWTNEITQLKERIALIADRAAEVHEELKKMGYEDTEETASGGRFLSTPETFPAPKHLVLKTSPIESDGSTSVDDADSDLTRLLAFSAEAPGLAKDAEEIATNFEKSNQTSLGTDIQVSFPKRADGTGMTDKPCGSIVDLVQAAVQELQKATLRMDTIAKQQSSEISDISRDPSLETVDPTQRSALTQETQNSLELHNAIVQSTHSLADTAKQVARDATESTQELDARTRELLASSGTFKGVRDSQDLANSLRVLSHASSLTNVPSWMTEARELDENESPTEGKKSGEYSDGEESVSFELMDVDTVSSPPPMVDSKSDFLATVEDLQKAQAVVLTARAGQTLGRQINRNAPPGKKSSIKRQVENHKVRIEEDVPFHEIPESKVSKRKKSGKTVRFAELPPSYSASKARRNNHSPLIEPPPPEAKNSNTDTDKSSAEISDSSIDVAQHGDTDRDEDELDPSNKMPLIRDECYVSPSVSANQTQSQQRHRTVPRRNTPRHLASRRAAAMRNALADRADSTVVNASKQTFMRNFGVGRRPVSMNADKPKAEPRKQPALTPVKAQTPSSPQVNTPESKSEASTIIVPLNDKPAPSTEVQLSANSEAEPVSPELDRKEHAPSHAVETAEAVVSSLDSNVRLENAYDGDRIEMHPPVDRIETTRPEEKRREPVVLVEESPQTHMGPRVSSLREEHTPKSKLSKRRHSSAHQTNLFLLIPGKAKKNQAAKSGQASSSSASMETPNSNARQVPAVERVDNLSDDESSPGPRRSLSTPEYRVSNAVPPRKQRENSTAGRLISFPSLHGKRKERDDGKVTKTASDRRRSSISGTNSPFSWLNGSDRRSNIGRGETYHSPPDSDAVFRQSSLFSGVRRSSVFGRRRSTVAPGSGRKERGDASPRPSRVRALKDRIAALL